MRRTSSNLAVRLACVKSLQSCLTLCDCQAPLSMGYFRQASWSELPHPPPGNLLNPGIKLKSPASPGLLVDSLLCGASGNGSPLQYSCLENLMDGGDWWAAVHGVAKSWRWLSNFTFPFHFPFSLSCFGKGNGNPLWCSCLENPRDRGAWWAAVYGVAQSRTPMKWFNSSSSSSWWKRTHLPMLEIVKDVGWIPASRRSPWVRRGNPLLYACLEKPMDMGFSPWGSNESDTLKQSILSFFFTTCTTWEVILKRSILYFNLFPFQCA